MHGHLLACLGLLLPLGHAAAQAAPAQERAQKRLAELVRPGAGFDSFGPRAEPVRWQAARALEQPSIPLPVYKGMPPPPDSPPRKEAAPRPPREEMPLVSFRNEPQPPRPVELALVRRHLLAVADQPEVVQPELLARPERLHLLRHLGKPPPRRGHPLPDLPQLADGGAHAPASQTQGLALVGAWPFLQRGRSAP